MTTEELEKVHQFSSNHRSEILDSDLCGCFHCLKTFEPTSIVEWVDVDEAGQGQTALCPFCGVDAVIRRSVKYDISRELLSEMRRYWFQRDENSAQVSE